MPMPPTMPQGNPFLQWLINRRQDQGQGSLQQGLAGLMQGNIGLGRGQGQMLRNPMAQPQPGTMGQGQPQGIGQMGPMGQQQPKSPRMMGMK